VTDARTDDATTLRTSRHASRPSIARSVRWKKASRTLVALVSFVRRVYMTYAFDPRTRLVAL